MTTPIGPKTPVIHRTETWHGIGLVIRLHGNTGAEVQWPGVDLTRRESIRVLTPAQFPMAWPLPVERKRRRSV
jgi:hypothetical protein